MAVHRYVNAPALRAKHVFPADPAGAAGRVSLEILAESNVRVACPALAPSPEEAVNTTADEARTDAVILLDRAPRRRESFSVT
jgi:hypothetical protein